MSNVDLSNRRWMVFGLVAIVVVITIWRCGASELPVLTDLETSRTRERSNRLWGIPFETVKRVGKGRVSGRVLYRGKPVADAAVQLVAEVLDERAITTRTTTTGDFILEGVPPGRYFIHGQLDSYSSRVLEVDLLARKEISGIDVVLIDCLFEIRGVIRDHRGVVGGARIAVRGALPTSSAEDGSYKLCVHRGKALIEIVAQGYAREVLPLYVRGSESLDFTLIPEATAEGRVIAAEDGSPVEGAVVAIKPLNSGDSAERTATTDAFGLFRFSNLMPGVYEYSAYSTGLATRSPQYFVATAETAKQLTCVLGPVGVVKGLVTLSSGEPLDGVRIHANSRDRKFVATSDRNGTFTLELPDGSYRLSSDSHDLVDNGRRLRITGAEVAELSLVVKKPGSLMGVTSFDGTPIPDATVVVRNQSWRLETTSDQNGRFAFSVLPTGSYELTGETAERFGRISIELTEGAPDQDTILELEYGASVSGRVLTEGRTPVPGVLVEFSKIGARDFGYAIADQRGFYRAGAMVGQGRYSVAVKLSHADLALPFASEAPVVVISRTELKGVDLIVDGARRSVAGQVVYSDGSPVPWVEVLVRDLSNEPWLPRMRTRAGPYGHFELLDVPDVAIGVVASSLETRTRVREIGRGDVVVRLVLPRSGSIAGELVGFHSPPEVRACTKRLGCFTARVHERRFRFIGIPREQYDLMAANQETSAVGRVDLATQFVETTLSAVGSGIVELRLPEAFRWPRQGIRCRWNTLLGSDVRHPVFPREPVSLVAGAALELRIPAGQDVVIECDTEIRSEVLRARANVGPGSRTSIELRKATRGR